MLQRLYLFYFQTSPKTGKIEHDVNVSQMKLMLDYIIKCASPQNEHGDCMFFSEYATKAAIILRHFIATQVLKGQLMGVLF